MTRSHRTAAAPGHRSRRSSADVENGILVATLEVLDEVGFEDLTVEAVAARAGSAKTGVYRRWPSKVPLVVEALVRAAPAPHAPDTGDLRQDMLGLWKSVASQATRSIERLLPLVTTYLGDDPELTALLRDRYFGPRRKAGRTIIERAAARGEISPAVDPDLALDLLFGPLVYRFLLGLPLDDETMGQLTGMAIEGLRWPGAERLRPLPASDKQSIRRSARRDYRQAACAASQGRTATGTTAPGRVSLPMSSRWRSAWP